MRHPVLLVVLSAALAATAQDVNTRPAARTKPSPAQQQPPRSDDQGESSSKDMMIDLSPPKGDAMAHPNSEAPDVGEMHPYNPMKALKDVEVGDYHFKNRNYPAAISRYREALEYKPHDAVATFALAQALEKNKNFSEAHDSYEDYLKILPNGPKSEDCKKALERLARSGKSK